MPSLFGAHSEHLRPYHAKHKGCVHAPWHTVEMQVTSVEARVQRQGTEQREQRANVPGGGGAAAPRRLGAAGGGLLGPRRASARYGGHGSGRSLGGHQTDRREGGGSTGVGGTGGVQACVSQQTRSTRTSAYGVKRVSVRRVSSETSTPK